MSDFAGPWQRPSGNIIIASASTSTWWSFWERFREYSDNGFTRGHDTLPDDAVPLVPQTEVAPLPTVDTAADLTPEVLRLAADVVDILGQGHPKWALADGHLRREADRLEAEQSEAATRERLVAAVQAEVLNELHGSAGGRERLAEDIARRLIHPRGQGGDRFTISLTEKK